MAQDILTSIWVWITAGISRLMPDYIMPNIQLLIQIAILLIVAYIVGRIGKIVVVNIFRRTGLRRIISRTWAESVLKATGYKGTVIELVGDLVKWLIYILFLGVIIDTAGLPGIAGIFTQIAVFMPRFIAAILLLVFGFIIADFFGKVFEEAGGKFLGDEGLGKFSGGVLKYSMGIVTIIMAMSLLGLDTGSLLLIFGALMISVVAILLLGIKDLVPNLSAGLHLKKNLKVGKKIKFGEHSGVVEKVEVFSTHIRTGKGIVIIPNSLLMKGVMERES